jgi:hypothetical protein
MEGLKRWNFYFYEAEEEFRCVWELQLAPVGKPEFGLFNIFGNLRL